MTLTPALTSLRRRSARAGLLALALGAATLAALSGRPSRSADTTAPAPPPPAPGTFRPTPQQWASLTLAPVQTASVSDAIVSDGQVATADDRSTTISSPYSGRVLRVFVTQGQYVREGQPLFSVASLELVQARADLHTALAQRTAAGVVLGVANTNAGRQLRREMGGAAAQRDRQQAQADVANAQSTLLAAEAAISSARGRLSILGAPANGGPENGVGVVRAPLSGIVITRTLGLGQTLQGAAVGGVAALITISDLSRVYVNANLREGDFARVHIGDAVEARVAALPGRVFRGRVEAVGGTVDPTSRRIIARATIANPGMLLRPGMFAEMRVVGHAAPASAPSVPESAVVYEGDGAHVWLAHPDHTLEVRQIKAGRTDAGAVQVLAGLRSGEQIVTGGAVFIDRAARPE